MQQRLQQQQQYCLQDIVLSRITQMATHVLDSMGVKSDESPHRARLGAYVVLIADEQTLPVMQAACGLHDLIEGGIYLVEKLHTDRQPMPALDALYFVEPSSEVVERLISDAEERGPMYRSFHIFFAHRLPEALLERAAASKSLAAKVRSFAEVNLSFLTYDEKSFHLADTQALRALLDGSVAEASALRDTACKLATFLASLGVQTPRVLARCAAGAARGKAPGVCERLAQEVQARVEEMDSLGAPWEDSSPLDTCSLLIVDRRMDWSAALVHDFHLQSLCYDVLGSAIDVSHGRFTYTDDAGTECTALLGERGDELWRRFRHQSIWDVRAQVVKEVEAWTTKDKAIRERATGASSMSQMVASTLTALHTLPEHKQHFKRLNVQVELCTNAWEQVKANQLLNLCELEHGIATGVGTDGSYLSRIERDKIVAILGDTTVNVNARERLLLLLASANAARPHTTGEQAWLGNAVFKEFTSLLPAESRWLVEADTWVNAQDVEAPGAYERWRAWHRARIRSLVSSADDRPARHLRWTPRAHGLLEELAAGASAERLQAVEVSSHCAPVHVAPRTTSATHSHEAGRRVVVVFVVGGVTLPEVQAAHQVSSALGVEAFVGGSCILTPSDLLHVLREVK